MKSVTLQVDDEVAALGDLIIQEKADLDAKLGLSAELAHAVPALLTLTSNYQKLSADVKNPDDIAYLVKCLADAFIPKAKATPVA